MSLVTAPDYFILQDHPPPATRKEERPVTTQLIDELRRYLRRQNSPDHKFRRPKPDEQEQMVLCPPFPNNPPERSMLTVNAIQRPILPYVFSRSR